jgi:hypothetical protein
LEGVMSYPLVDSGYTMWCGDLDTQLKRLHGFTARELGFDSRSLVKRYYAGESIFSIIDELSMRQFRLAAE